MIKCSTYRGGEWIVAVVFLSAHGFGAETTWVQPYLPWGDPDLQGKWNFSSRTALERDDKFGDQRYFTEQQVQEYRLEQDARMQAVAAPVDPNAPAPAVGGDIGQFASESLYVLLSMPNHLVEFDGQYPTALITQPASGKLPKQTDAKQLTFRGQLLAQGHGEFDGPELRDISERCLSIWQVPSLHSMDLVSSNVKILQTKDAVVMAFEALNDVRIIRLNASHRPDVIKQWMGDAVGYWDKNTLVVKTKNFRPEQTNNFFGSSAHFELTEWFTRTDATTMHYRYTVHDPVIYTQDWTVDMTFNRLAEDFRLLEYACHEGNYSLPNILAGARREERSANND